MLTDGFLFFLNVNENSETDWTDDWGKGMSGSKHLMDIDGDEYLIEYVNLGQGPFYLTPSF